VNKKLTHQQYADSDNIQTINLYPSDKDGQKDITYGWFAFYFVSENVMYEYRYRALSLNEAIGAFLVENPDITYNEIIEHCEI
jgi:hypothetical protein